MRRALLLVACLVPFAGCADVFIERGEPESAEPFLPDESVGIANGTADEDGTTSAPARGPPASDAWPREGSHVEYEWRVARRFSEDQHTEAHGTLRWTYADGDWRGDCQGTMLDHRDPNGWNNRTIHQEYAAASPPHWPLLNTRDPPAEGTEMRVWVARYCTLMQVTLAYAGADTESVELDEGPRVVATHRATGDYPSEQLVDWSVDWSQRSGLVVAWSYAKGGSDTASNTGQLVSTDAPL